MMLKNEFNRNLQYKHSCVIDAQNRYKSLVLVCLVENEEHQQKEQIQYYELLEGETLVDTAPPTMRSHAGAEGFVSPKWDTDTSSWAEAATPEEITTWEVEHPAPPDPAPTAQEQLRADVDFIAAMTGVIL